jgi:predicted RNase H-like nuclease (RuvC/YqgF family)
MCDDDAAFLTVPMSKTTTIWLYFRTIDDTGECYYITPKSEKVRERMSGERSVCFHSIDAALSKVLGYTDLLAKVTKLHERVADLKATTTKLEKENEELRKELKKTKPAYEFLLQWKEEAQKMREHNDKLEKVFFKNFYRDDEC